MKKGKICLLEVFVLASLIFVLASLIFGGNVSYSDDQSKQEELYKKAISLKDEGDYNGAYEILKKLVSESPNIIKYEISYVDTVLDQCLELKNSNNSEWKTKAKEAGDKIKLLYRTSVGNADYYLVYAKYSWIVESKRESNIFKALDKAFYFKPNYTYANIVKGDIYSGLAKNANVLEQPMDSVTLTGGASANTKHMLAMTAKTSYESALSSSDIDDKKKAYVHYKLGELEYQILGNKADAKANWEKAVAISPDSKIGKLSKKRLEQ